MAEIQLPLITASLSMHPLDRAPRRRFTIRLAALAACAALTASCIAGPQSPPTTPPATPPATQPDVTDERPKEPVPPATTPTIAGAVELGAQAITLLEAGAEPRATLRRIVAKGDASACEVVTNLKIVMQMSESATGTQVLPDTRRILQMRVTDVNDQGDAAFDLEFTESTVMPTPAVPESSVEAVRGDVASIVGSRGSGVMSSRGVVRRSGVTLPLAANPAVAPQVDQVLKAIDQLAAAFPIEPVGVGARWRIEADQISNGVRSRLAHEITLRRIDGTKVVLDIVISETAAAQNITNRPLPPGATLRLDSLKVNGRGSAIIDLTHLALVAGNSTVTSEAAMTALEADGRTQSITQKMQVGTIVSPPATSAPAATKPAAN